MEKQFMAIGSSDPKFIKALLEFCNSFKVKKGSTTLQVLDEKDPLDRFETYDMLLLAAKHLLMAAEGPIGGPTDWNETRQDWIDRVESFTDLSIEKVLK